jgi:RimJ/RimL family protein N-acetyltransferase
MNIRGKRVVLRAVEAQDLPVLHKWHNDPSLTNSLGERHFPSSLYQQERWYERIQTDERTIRLIAQDLQGAPVGYTGFWDINWRDGRAEHALLVGEDAAQGRGLGREIILTCARYAFGEMGLHRLDASILETNEKSRKAYEACGYRVEGVLREHALRGGERVNRLVLGLLSEEYFKLIEATRYWEEGEETRETP